MSFVIIKDKKYDVKSFNKGGYNKGYINFTKHKIGKIIELTEERKINKTLDTEFHSENPYREIEIFKECNKIIQSKITTNLVKFYDYHIYNNNIIIIMDKYDGDLSSIINDLNMKQLWSIFFQIFFTFIILQDKLGFYQGDFGLSNIFYKKSKTKYFNYVYNGIKFKVVNEGYKIAVADYGNAIIDKFILANYEKEYYPISITKRIELYEIIYLFINLFKKIKLNNYFKSKLILLEYIIDNQVVFNIYNNIYTINSENSKPANYSLLLMIFSDYIFNYKPSIKFY